MKGKSYLFFRISIHLVFLVLVLFSSRDVSASLPQKRVLLLYSEDRDHPAHEITGQGIRAIFHSNTLFDVQLHTEYLDLSRFSGPAYAHAFADYLRSKYAGKKIDTIIMVYPAAVEFLLREAIELFPDTPIVANQVPRGYAENLKHSPPSRPITGTITGDNTSGILDFAFRVKPGTKHVALVGGTAPNDIYSERLFRKGLDPYLEKLDLIDLSKLPMQEILTRIASLPSDTIVLYAGISRDGKGQSFVPREALLIISRATNAPVFGLYDSFMGYGIVGGRLVSWEQLGGEAASLALRIMGGESPASIPFGGEQAYVDLYDWRELKRWGISEVNLPAGSIVKYREPSLWTEHKGQIIGGIGLLLLEAILIIALVLNLRKARRMGKELFASEIRYRTVADYTYDWEYWAAPDGTLNYVSPACELISGYSPQRFIDNPAFFREVVVPEDREAWDQHEHQVSIDLKRQETQFRIRRADGEIRWIEHACRPVIGVKGEFLGIRASNRDITIRKQAEEKDLEREKDLRNLAARLISAQEDERRRLGRELHDDLAQRLAVLAIHAGKMEQASRDGHAPGPQEFRGLQDQAVRISADVHALSRQLHPSILDDLGLERAVESECTRFASREGIDVVFRAENIPGTIPQEVSLSIYRIIQESLNNIAKHACADHVSVCVQGMEHGLRASIEDDGIGFDPAAARGKPGLGLSSMHERVRIIHGELHIKSEPEKGTTIEVRAPLES